MSREHALKELYFLLKKMYLIAEDGDNEKNYRRYYQLNKEFASLLRETVDMKKEQKLFLTFDITRNSIGRTFTKLYNNPEKEARNKKTDLKKAKKSLKDNKKFLEGKTNEPGLNMY